MTLLQPGLYAEWRVCSGVAPLLHDDCDSPPERLLQAIWLHQRLLRDELRTVDGRPVRIFHPGFHSVEGGPDFREALIQIGNDDPKPGDIEVDLRASGWRSHGHDRNPAFRGVILHVVWEADRAPAEGPPLMALRRVLDAPIGQLSLWMSREASQEFPDHCRGKCAATLRQWSADQVASLLQQAAEIRLRSKAAGFEARARRAGWEQALWEGLFRALGYKHNIWPMQGLAERRSAWLRGAPDLLPLQARLFGISNLLPADLPPAGGKRYLRRIWDCWWRERDEFSDCVLPTKTWRMHGLRPANHPQRRLALASHWSMVSDLPARLQKWCAEEIPREHLPGSLLEVLQVGRDEFWSWHCTFRAAPFKSPQPLLGVTRTTDLGINVVIPWLWSRAAEGKSPAMQRRLEERYRVWPAAEDNSVLRLARERVLGGASTRAFPGAACQQGLLQIVRDFCDHSNSTCDQCPFPELLQHGMS